MTIGRDQVLMMADPGGLLPDLSRWVMRSAGAGRSGTACSNLRTLAARREFAGAKLGASVARHQATRGDVQPASPQVSAMPGHAQRCLAMAGACMACKRSGVRISVAPL